MPYRWTPDTDHIRLELWPHRSLPLDGFAKVILIAFVLILIPVLPFLGTYVLWGLLPFLMLAIAGLWWGLQRSYQDAKLLEILVISPDETHLTRTAPNGTVQNWHGTTYWIRANLHPNQGPVPFYITLSGQGREVELGAFLSEDERKVLYGELADQLKRISGR